MKKIDLHIHTTASDGSFTPGEIVDMALNKGLSAIAITDHDTVAGIKEALRAAENTALEIVPGVEISTEYSSENTEITLHLLGYFIDHHDAALIDTLKWMQEIRDQRNPRIIKRLNDLGIPVKTEEVAQAAGEGVVGRPHIAEVLIRHGVVETMDEAFDRYLGTNGQAYVPKTRISLEKAIDLILAAGGIPVLAHPMILTRKHNDIEKLLPAWIQLGLKGIEVWYTEHTEKETEYYSSLADRFELVKTGGSDFHGVYKPGVEIGTGAESLSISFDLLKTMKKSLRSQ
ncbi:PHP domain-containing protein [Calditrichota bacterium]